MPGRHHAGRGSNVMRSSHRAAIATDRTTPTCKLPSYACAGDQSSAAVLDVFFLME